MARTIATNTRSTATELLEFIRPRHHAILMTTRGDGRPQSSPVTCGVDAEGRIVISTYPERAKATNVRRDPRVVGLRALRRLRDGAVGAGRRRRRGARPARRGRAAGRVLPRASPASTRTGTSTAQAMRDQGKSLIRVTIDALGPDRHRRLPAPPGQLAPGKDGGGESVPIGGVSVDVRPGTALWGGSGRTGPTVLAGGVGSAEVRGSGPGETGTIGTAGGRPDRPGPHGRPP